MTQAIHFQWLDAKGQIKVVHLLGKRGHNIVNYIVGSLIV
jgi:hypothetical protein